MSQLQNSLRRSRVAASPRARRLMRLHGIDAHSIAGSGPGGRIVERDLSTLPQSDAVERARLTPAAVTTLRDTDAASSMRQAIARVTTLSATTVPQFHLRAEIDATPLVALRGQLLAKVEVECGARLSLTDLVLRAQALALRDLPQANSIWQEGRARRLASVDLGLVVSLPDGLLIPIIRAADGLSLAGLLAERKHLVELARAGKIASDAAPSASSLSNLGNSRVDEFAGLVSPPQSTMLAIGRVAERPWVSAGQLIARPTLRLDLAVDHRVLDGAPAAELLGRIVEYLENPALLVYGSG